MRRIRLKQLSQAPIIKQSICFSPEHLINCQHVVRHFLNFRKPSRWPSLTADAAAQRSGSAAARSAVRSLSLLFDEMKHQDAAGLSTLLLVAIAANAIR